MADKEFPQKKVLSLVLCVAVMLSVMVMGAGAAFSDQDKIENTEAVNMCTALNIIGGYEDGSYHPERNIERSEITKMICVALNGGKEPNLGTPVTPTFSDVRGSADAWAEKYIESCVAQGIVSGVGGGRFSPAGNVTGSQLAKMLLVCLGYDADIEGFTGNAWDTNVNVRASQKGLYEGLENMDVSAAITRDNAAQMVWNALNAYEIEYKTKIITDENGNLITVNEPVDKVVAATNDKITLLEDKYEAKTFTGTFNGNADVCGLKDGEIQVEGSVDSETPPSKANFTYDFDLKYIGEEVDVLFKDGTGGTNNKPDNKDTIYGVVVTGATTVYNVTKGDLQDQKKDGTIRFGDEDHDVVDPDKGDEYIVKNYGVESIATKNDATADNLADAMLNSLKESSGDTIKFVCNDDGEIVKAYVVEYGLGTVTAVNSEKVTISGLGSIQIADNAVYDSIAKDDVVVYSQWYDKTLANAYVTVTKAETVSGEVTGYKVQESVTLDSTVYDIHKGATMPTNVAGETGIQKFADDDIGETVTLYLINGYVGAAVQTSESANNYSLVVDVNDGTAGNNWKPLKLVVMDAEGTKTTLTVDEDSDLKQYSDYHIGDIVTWTGSAEEALVDVEAAFTTKDSNANYEKVTKGTTIYDATAKTFNGTVTASDCVLFVTTDGNTTQGNLNAERTFKAYNIRDLKDLKAGDADIHTISVTDDGKVVAAFVLLGKAPSGATSSAVYGIVTDANGKVKVDDTYYNQYIIASNDETYTVNVKLGTLTEGKIVAFAPTTDNLYDTAGDFAVLSNQSLTNITIDGSNYAADVVAVKDYDENDQLLTYYTSTKKGNDTYVGENVTTKAVADDVTIVYVDVDNDTAGDEIGVPSFDGVTGYMNAIVVMDDDNVITHIIVETSGEANIYA
ncbi:S-layer homology domain-containing protein [Evtepia gabavorous]|uniref:S-layer homology domain-containing protein n=1 Tax=Evtepia gabavorous TaxID=2211183 RepID=UPI003A90D4D6